MSEYQHSQKRRFFDPKTAFFALANRGAKVLIMVNLGSVFGDGPPCFFAVGKIEVRKEGVPKLSFGTPSHIRIACIGATVPTS